QLVESGNLQAAIEKQQEINKALYETPAAAKVSAEALKQAEAAFERLGVISSQTLKDQAAAAKRDYETIRDSGVASARDVQEAFKKAAEAAIAANGGIAPSWVKAQAAVRGYVDEAKKAAETLKQSEI